MKLLFINIIKKYCYLPFNVMNVFPKLGALILLPAYLQTQNSERNQNISAKKYAYYISTFLRKR